MTKHEELNIIKQIIYIYLSIPSLDILGLKEADTFVKDKASKKLRDVYLSTSRMGKQIIQKEKLNHKIWLIISSVNNKNTLAFLEKGLGNTVCISTNASPVNNPLKNYSSLSFHKKYVKNITFKNLIETLKKNFDPERIDFIKSKIWESFYLFENALDILKSGNPKALVFSNDHNLKNRALLLAAKHLNIPTVYIQHAAVTKYFPPLNFDLNLLEGQDTLDKYLACGPIEGKVALIGMTKLDEFHKKRTFKKTIEHVGICANILDNKDRLMELITLLHAQLPNLKISFRPHPRDSRTFDLGKKISFSDARKTPIFEFLNSVDLIIASNTSSHLEACLLNIPSIYYKFSEDLIHDYYGFVKNNLIPYAESDQELVNLIQDWLINRPMVFEKAKYYNHLVGSPMEGQSKKAAIQEIKNLLN